MILWFKGNFGSCESKANSFFCLTKARAHVLERREKSKERKRRKKRKKENEKKAKPRYVFVLNSWVFWIPKVLVWRIVAPLSRVLEEITQTLDFVKVL